MQPKIIATVAFLFCTAIAAPVMAQDYYKGITALEAGDFTTAAEELRPLAELGLAEAQSMIGTMYYNGYGFPQDNIEAVKWFRLSAEQGYSEAQAHLGSRYYRGQGVRQDYSEAVRWFRLSAEQGEHFAQLMLGYFHQTGEGVLQEAQFAHMWYNIASANGSASGGPMRDEIAASMTPSAIEKAQRRARVCMASNYQDCD